MLITTDTNYSNPWRWPKINFENQSQDPSRMRGDHDLLLSEGRTLVWWRPTNEDGNLFDKSDSNATGNPDKFRKVSSRTQEEYALNSYE